MKFLIGQRVIVGSEIGIVVKTEEGGDEAPPGSVWVRLSSNKYASCYSESNVKPLPNGQL